MIAVCTYEDTKRPDHYTDCVNKLYSLLKDIDMQIQKDKKK